MTTSSEISDYRKTILEAEETRKGEAREGRGHNFGIFNGNGVQTFKINDSRITPFSDVTASIGEMDANFRPHMGDAVMTVHNVVPVEGGVLVRVNVAHDRSLRFLIMVTSHRLP